MLLLRSFTRRPLPVILTTGEEANMWLIEDTAVALKLQHPLPNAALRIVAKGEKEDGPVLDVRTCVASRVKVQKYE